MTVQQFNRFRKAVPFEPFVIHLADQRMFGVTHPDAVILSESGRTVMVLNNDKEVEVLDMLLITSLRPYSQMERRHRYPIKR